MKINCLDSIAGLAIFLLSAAICRANNFDTCTNVETPSCNLEVQLLSITYTTCFGAQDGEIIIEPGGGTEPYSYLWNTGESGNRITAGAGVYSVTITDAENCELIINNLEIQDFDPIIINILNNKPASCDGIPDGEFSWNVSGGFEPYRFYIDGIQIQGTSTSVANGNYQFLVEDATGCTKLTEVNIGIESNIEIIIEEIVPGLSCLDNQGASILISVSGGTSPYQVNWEDGSTGYQTNTPLEGNNYVTITDNSGCRVLDSVYLEPLESGISIDTIIVEPVSCAFGEDGRIEIIIGEGLPPFSVNWFDENDSLIRNPSPVGKI
jgi:large repetitive protein